MLSIQTTYSSIMNLEQLRQRTTNLGVRVSNEFNAFFYLSVLETIQTKLTRIPEKNYITQNLKHHRLLIQQGFEKENLHNLLNNYAVILDNIVATRVAHEISRKNIDAHSNDKTYTVKNFYKKYPFLKKTIKAVETNAVVNMERLAIRIIADFTDLKKMFGRNMYRLKKVGYQQNNLNLKKPRLFFLTFATTTGKEIQVGYKPFDLESECLTIGNSQALRRVDPNFFGDAKSFHEIINDKIRARPDYNTSEARAPHLLPVYKLLPRNWDSAAPSEHSFESPYGYIEILPKKRQKLA